MSRGKAMRKPHRRPDAPADATLSRGRRIRMEKKAKSATLKDKRVATDLSKSKKPSRRSRSGRKRDVDMTAHERVPVPVRSSKQASVRDNAARIAAVKGVREFQADPFAAIKAYLVNQKA